MLIFKKGKSMESIKVAKDVFAIEIEALHQVLCNLDENFQSAVDLIVESGGRAILCGMGKSGIIGKKIAASFASTGTPSFFMHPGEAFHGDLGMVRREDVFIAISYSGETEEVVKLLPFLHKNQNLIVSITGNKLSTLASNSNYHLDVSVPKEACKLQLAPTSSTTATLVMGDALTVALMEKRNFTPEDFAVFHPGGALGRKLLSRVKDEMTRVPPILLSENSSFTDIVSCISSGRLGFSLIMTERDDRKDYSVITDGDLRRAMQKYENKVFSVKAIDIASASPLFIQDYAKTELAYEVMEKNKVNFLLVLDSNEELIGVIKK